MKGFFPKLPFLNGAYVAVDAVPGAFLIVDGPYCVSTKAEMQHCHNLRSEVLRPLGRPRVLHTAGSATTEEVAGLAGDRVASVENLFEEVCSWPEAESLYATSFDFHELVNFPLKDIAARFSGRHGKPVRFIPSASLGGSWLDGYSRFCEALARGIELPRSSPGPRAAAIVGYLFDRDEPDHRGGIRELRRMLKALGWSLSCVWLSGVREAELKAVSQASVIVSLPYAREAGRILAGRLRARLVEADLPLGLKATEGFMLRLGSFLGAGDQARAFVEAETRAAMAETQTHVQRFIKGRGALVHTDDPALAKALAGLCEELGLHSGPRTGGRRIVLGPNLVPGGNIITVPVGYPNYLEHPVLERPVLGYTGFRHLVDKVTRAILALEGPG